MNKVQNENSTLKSTLAKMNQEQSLSNSRLTNMTNLKNQLDNKVKISNEQLATMKQELQNAKTTNQQVGQRLNLKTKELEGFKLQVNALNAEQQKLIGKKLKYIFLDYLLYFCISKNFTKSEFKNS